jgi:hypothetical protein
MAWVADNAVDLPLDNLVGSGGGSFLGGGGLEGVTGSSPGKDCFCCSGVSAEMEREMKVVADLRRAETSATSGSLVSVVSKLTSLWFRYSHCLEVALNLTNLSW